MKALIIENDHDLNNAIARLLNDWDYDCVFDGVQALNYISENNYDLVIIDTNIPRISSNEVISKINQKYYVPIIVILNYQDNNDSIINNLLNISDYLFKPFCADNLLFFLNKIKEHHLNKTTIEYGNTILNYEDFSITNLNSSIKLTICEFDFLENLINHKSVLNSYIAKTSNIDAYKCMLSINRKLKIIHSNYFINYNLEKGYSLLSNYD